MELVAKHAGTQVQPVQTISITTGMSDGTPLHSALRPHTATEPAVAGDQPVLEEQQHSTPMMEDTSQASTQSMVQA